MDEITQLVRFAETAKGLETLQKLKLVLFAIGAKPNTYVVLKINPKNLEEKAHFENHLKHNKIIFKTSKPKSYEEITQIKDNIIKWEIQGTWYGYDLFRTKNAQKKFYEYKKLLRQQKHKDADQIAGELYGYPKCCIKEYTKEHNTQYIKQKYTYCQFYKKIKEQDKKFPFIFHYPCSQNCNSTKKINSKYLAAIKKFSRKLFEEYNAKEEITADVIIDAESDIYDDNAKSIWQKKDCTEYSMIALNPINGHHYMFCHITKAILPKGTIARAKIKMQNNYAEIKILALKDFIADIHHERKFLVN